MSLHKSSPRKLLRLIFVSLLSERCNIQSQNNENTIFPSSSSLADGERVLGLFHQHPGLDANENKNFISSSIITSYLRQGQRKSTHDKATTPLSRPRKLHDSTTTPTTATTTFLQDNPVYSACFNNMLLADLPAQDDNLDYVEYTQFLNAQSPGGNRLNVSYFYELDFNFVTIFFAEACVVSCDDYSSSSSSNCCEPGYSEYIDISKNNNSATVFEQRIVFLCNAINKEMDRKFLPAPSPTQIPSSTMAPSKEELSSAPSTLAPSTEDPSSVAPSTWAPSTSKPSSYAPSTDEPSYSPPSFSPSTMAPAPLTSDNPSTGRETMTMTAPSFKPNTSTVASTIPSESSSTSNIISVPTTPYPPTTSTTGIPRTTEEPTMTPVALARQRRLILCPG